MKRRISTILLLFFFCITMIIPFQALAATTFPDIKGHWARDYINQLCDQGYIKGYPDGSFKPDRNMSKAEFTSALITCLGVTADDSTGVYFSDISHHWAKAFINEAAKRGILVPSEYPNGLQPDYSIKRSEACAMLVRAMGKSPGKGIPTFKDQDNLEKSIYCGYIKTACDLGIMSGFPDGNFKPFSYMTRAQVCTVLNKTLNLMGKGASQPGSLAPAKTGNINYVAIGNDVYDIHIDPITLKVDFQEVRVSSFFVSGSSLNVNGSYALKLDSFENNPDIIIYNNRYSFDKLVASGDKLVLLSPYRKVYRFKIGNYTYDSDYVRLYINSANQEYYLSDMKIKDQYSVIVGNQTYDLRKDRITIAVNRDFYDIKKINLLDRETSMQLEATDPVVISGLSLSDISAIFVDTANLPLNQIGSIRFIIAGKAYLLSQVTIDATGNFTVAGKSYPYSQVLMIIDDLQHVVNHIQINKSKFIFYCSEGNRQEWIIVNNEYHNAEDVKLIKDGTIYDANQVLVVSRNLLRIKGNQYPLDSSIKCRLDNKVYTIELIDYNPSLEATIIRTGDSVDSSLASQPSKFVFFKGDIKYQEGTAGAKIYGDDTWLAFDQILITDPSHFMYRDKVYNLLGARLRIDGEDFKITDTSWHGLTEVLDIFIRLI